MYNKLQQIFLLQLILIVFIIYILYVVFSPSKNVVVNGKSIKKTNIWKTFDVKTIIIIVLASLGLTMFLTFYTDGLISKSIVFITVLCLAPYFVLNTQKRVKQDKTFKDVMLYCANTVMLLKQNYNVYDSLTEVSKDLGPELRNDIEVLKEAFKAEKSSSKVKDVMHIMQEKYPYFALNNLNIILLIRHYDTAKNGLPSSLYDTYQEDLAKLEQDVNTNKKKRTTMRITYIFLTFAGVAMYFYFYNDLSQRLSIFDNNTFKYVNLIFTLLIVLSLFFVDRYFNNNNTKE